MGRRAKMKSKFYVLMILLTFLALTSLTMMSAQASLTLTVQTDKTKYNIGDTLTFSGTLTQDGAPVSNGLVAIQIVDPIGYPFVFRTVNTGTEPQHNWLVEILSVVPSDELGIPKTSFRRGTNAYFKVTINNTSGEPKNVTLVLNCYYNVSHEIPFSAVIYFQGSIPPGIVAFISPVIIPDNAPICTARVYANAYTQLPENVGYSYCPEESATFSITSSTTSSQSAGYEASQASDGTFNVVLDLPNSNIRVGSYILYASTVFAGTQAFAYDTFEVILLGDVNGDKTVDIFDAVLLAKASGSTPSSPNWDPRCDLNNDGFIDIFDAVLLSANAGKTAL
jgi:hypothetical protein